MTHHIRRRPGEILDRLLRKPPAIKIEKYVRQVPHNEFRWSGIIHSLLRTLAKQLHEKLPVCHGKRLQSATVSVASRFVIPDPFELTVPHSVNRRYETSFTSRIPSAMVRKSKDESRSARRFGRAIDKL